MGKFLIVLGLAIALIAVISALGFGSFGYMAELGVQLFPVVYPPVMALLRRLSEPEELEERLAALDDVPGDQLVVLHQKGSHGPSYFERYPPAFRRFTPTCDSSVSACSRLSA